MMLQERAQVNETLGLWDVTTVQVWYHHFSGTREHQNGKNTLF